MYYLQNLCLLCLKSSVTLKNIYHVDSDNVSILDKLEYTTVLFGNDFHGTSLYICDECHINLNNTYAFKHKSIQNINNLKAYTHQLSAISQKFKYLSVVLDKNSVKQILLDQFYMDKDEFGSEDIIDQNESNKNIHLFETVVQNNIKVEDLNEQVTLAKQVEEDVSVFKREEDIDIDSELFEKEISNTDVKHDVENKLIVHTRTHTGKKPFNCQLCLKVFTAKSSLIMHTRTHTGEKRFKCHLCSKAFIQNQNLMRHIRSHTGEKPFKCHLCSKGFTQKYHLMCHIRTHTGEKPFKCYLCSKAFIQKRDLSMHIRTHAGEKPFNCQLCSKSFIQKVSLSRHLITHTGEKPFKCHLCSKAFIEKQNLMRHIRSHTGEKPFKCHLCSKAYIQKHHLICHIRTHTGEKPFKCHLCPKAFVRKYILKKHITTHDDTTFPNENVDILESGVQNNIKVEDIFVFKSENIVADSELFEKQISNGDVKPELKNKLIHKNIVRFDI